METDSFGMGQGWRNRGSLGVSYTVFLFPPSLFNHPRPAMKGWMLPAPVTPGLVLEECLALASPLRVSVPISQDRKFAPGEDLLWLFTSHFISVPWGKGEKRKGQGERNQVTRAAQ